MNYYELKAKANKLRQEKNLSEAIKYYEEMYSNNHQECDHWDIWGYAYCLKANKEYKNSADICEAFLSEQEINFPQLNNVYAWSLFFLLDDGMAEINQKSLDTIDKIIELCAEDLKYSPLVKTIFKVAKIAKNSHDYELMLKYLYMLPVDKLENRETSVTTSKSKKMTISSDMEIYYLYLSEALLKTERFNDCIALCKQALSKLNKPFNRNNTWLERRMGLCYLKSEDHEKALQILLKTASFKKEWFIYKEIADVYLKMNDYDKSYDYALKAASQGGDFSKKVNLFKLLGDLLEIKKENHQALLCYQLTYKIREENNWPIVTELHQKICFEPIIEESTGLFQEVSKLWKEKKADSREMIKGVINSILPNNKAGFIKADDGKSFYFSFRDNNLQPESLKVGDIVQFSLVDSFDKKKNKPSQAAANIKVDTKQMQ